MQQPLLVPGKVKAGCRPASATAAKRGPDRTGKKW